MVDGPAGRWSIIGRDLPRAPLGHSIITPSCREVQPDALVEAVERLRASYDDVVARYPDDVKVHVLLVATWPQDEDCPHHVWRLSKAEGYVRCATCGFERLGVIDGEGELS